MSNEVPNRLRRRYEVTFSQVPHILTRHPKVSLLAKMMWIYLDSHSQEYLDTHLTNKQIINELDISLNTVKKAFDELNRIGIAEIKNTEIKKGFWQKTIDIFNPEDVLEPVIPPSKKEEKKTPPLSKYDTPPVKI